MANRETLRGAKWKVVYWTENYYNQGNVFGNNDGDGDSNDGDGDSNDDGDDDSDDGDTEKDSNQRNVLFFRRACSVVLFVKHLRKWEHLSILRK